ncbi:hypothetical protein [Agrobacterium tumefaciens]|uniref:hypothetical protein n=1 Tax=Agrobacterium tumefaciens TaxID=358 RepID=UPI001FA9583E|nr:hypothetical protein [Agrobacterium tumefaciens]UNZ52618.1 hypothetical protein MLE07_17720 [Agrobacterium tumefaciens]
MAYRLINLADLTEPLTPIEEVRTAAFLLQLDIVETRVGAGFIDVRGDEDAITQFLVAIRHRDFTYRSSQIGDTDDDI